MKDWLNLPWWQDKTPLEKETGQYVLNVGAAGFTSKKQEHSRTPTGKLRARCATTPEQSPQKSMRRGLVENLHQDEFGLRDALAGRPLDAVVACPDCGGRPVFDRRSAGLPDGHAPFEYRVRCQWGKSNWEPNDCEPRTTPWMPSLDLAVRHWTLSIKLAK